ncbi:MAG: nucleotidyltransferase [Gammaproteobacteria bacterium]|nr:nucleotidyltransferase [Gammaproteobacteria bacterium]
MKKQHSRETLAREAARLMYEEGVNQYFDAKRLAAKRIFGRSGGRKMRYRPQDLPSNGEIQEKLVELAGFHEGTQRLQRLFAMRVIALETMLALAAFRPGLIGSVSTGSVRRNSDIDIHVFTDDLEAIEVCLHELGWRFETKQVTVRASNQFKDYTHIYCKREFPIELSVYPEQEIRTTSRSSTDGKPIRRIKPTALQALIAKEHPDEWEIFLKTRKVTGLDIL